MPRLLHGQELPAVRILATEHPVIQPIHEKRTTELRHRPALVRDVVGAYHPRHAFSRRRALLGELAGRVPDGD